MSLGLKFATVLLLASASAAQDAPKAHVMTAAADPDAPRWCIYQVHFDKRVYLGEDKHRCDNNIVGGDFSALLEKKSTLVLATPAPLKLHIIQTEEAQ